jgi:hypothetical protein
MSAGRRAARGIGAYLQRGQAPRPRTVDDMAAFVPPRPLGAVQQADSTAMTGAGSAC